jgi:tetratricopeptide (TPR) repeat protein
MAHKYVLEAIKLDPQNTEANALLSRVLCLMGESELASNQINSFQKNMFETTDNACLFMNLKVINEQPDYQLIKAFGDIIRFGGKKSEYERIALGNVYYMEKNFKDAMRYYKEAWGKNNESYVTAYNIGNLYFVQGYFNEAVKWYEHSLDLNPESEDARLALAQVYLNQDRYAAASILTFGMEGKLLPKKANYEKFNLIGNIYLENFMYQKAQQCFKLAAGIEKEGADAWAGLALVHYKMNNYDSSMAYVSKALSIEPDNHELLLLESTIIFYRGYYHNIKSDSYYNRAISNLQAILMKDNSNNTAMNLLMIIYNQLNMTEEASEMYSQFTSNSSVNWILHNTMIMIETDNGNLLKVKNDTNGAFRHYNFAINHGLNAYEKSENELFILNNMGAAYTYVDSLALAMDNFLQLPQWSVVQNNIAIVYALQGDTVKAIEKFEEIYRNDSTAWFAIENIRILTGESPHKLYNPKRGKKNSITYKPGLIRMFYFNFEVNYTFNLKLLPLFQMHDPEFSCPQAEGTNIPNHKYPKPNRYNSANKIYYN